MKNQLNVFFMAIAISIVVFACNKKPENKPDVEQSISTQDIQATTDMNAALAEMHHDLDSLQATQHHNRQQHWDSMYHHHDSIYWHHHGIYSHGNMHDDHTHTYLPYHHNPTYYHHYPGHETDSLVIHNNSHHHDSSNYLHHHGHDLGHHHILDSLELIHHKYH